MSGFVAISWCIRQCATSVSGEASPSFIPATSFSSRAAVKLPSLTIPRATARNVQFQNPLCSPVLVRVIGVYMDDLKARFLRPQWAASGSTLR